MGKSIEQRVLESSKELDDKVFDIIFKNYKGEWNGQSDRWSISI